MDAKSVVRHKLNYDLPFVGGKTIYRRCNVSIYHSYADLNSHLGCGISLESFLVRENSFDDLILHLLLIGEL